ncbi:MAG: 23S rRNA (pseudouridine(1915)-N(3))-methyltransferase RlmH [Thiovulaceae bacterium]|nr:23S rRNA (pseudouridine(1915)-N(3))-methyltransferase RlmH [Sulfurimonadaceae bacterium]
MKINILSIAKKEKDNYDLISKNYQKLISRFAKTEDITLFNKRISQAQTQGRNESQEAYREVLEPYLSKSYNILLHPDGKLIDSFDFSKLLSDKMSINFFIGGAFGFDEKFIQQGDSVISLGKLTMSHKIAKVVLLEQIYRGFSILNNHPYHK